MIESFTVKCQNTRRVLILLNQSLKAARDEISGILRAASRHSGVDVRIFDRNLPPEDLRQHISSWIPDGIITDNRGAVPAILPGSARNCITFNGAKTRHIPVVYLDFSNPAASSVNIDDSAIGACAATFFLKRKYENFAFVGTNLSHTAAHSKARFLSFENTLKAAGRHSVNFIINEDCADAWTDELDRLRRWISELPKPCAVFTHADVYARLVNDACRLAKVSIPEQIALIGVDNEIDIVDNLHPTLSSILPDFQRAGELTFEVLCRLISSRRIPRTPIRATYGVKALVERGSTHDTHGTGRLVDAARAIIRARSHEGLRVADITRELNVSPRLLELHFRNVLGRSIRDELLNFRLEEVKHLLDDRNVPIETIALQCGWRSSTALKHLFKKKFGVSMRAFRNRRRQTQHGATSR